MSGLIPQLKTQLQQLATRRRRLELWSRLAGCWAAVARVAHLVALVLFAVVLSGLRTTGGHSLLARIPESRLTVTPGDTSLERGNSLVVLARFSGNLPPTVDLVISQPAEPAPANSTN